MPVCKHLSAELSQALSYFSSDVQNRAGKLWAGKLSVEKLCSWHGLSTGVGSVEMLCFLHLHQI